MSISPQGSVPSGTPSYITENIPYKYVFRMASDPMGKDTDGDGLLDNQELIKYGDNNIKLASNPLKKDSDGDGALDNEDKEPLIKNYFSKMNYIFYNKDQEWFIKYEAENRRNIFEMQGENIEIFPISQISQFKNKWDSMGLVDQKYKKYDIDQVVLVCHGHPNFISIASDAWLYSSSNLIPNYSTDISINDLSVKQINILRLSNCNTGNIDYFNTKYPNNLACEFLSSKNTINKVFAWDGFSCYEGFTIPLLISGSWEWAEGGGDFDIWSQDINGRIRKPEGILIYYKNMNGVVTYKNA